MEWITGLFRDRHEKKQINRMVLIAAHEQMINPQDVELLTSDSAFISYDELIKKERIFHFKKGLPQSAKEKFKLVFFLIRTQMKNGALSNEKENALSRLIQVLNVSREKANELVSFLKSNIRNGLSYEESYERLGYLLEGSKFN